VEPRRLVRFLRNCGGPSARDDNAIAVAIRARLLHGFERAYLRWPRRERSPRAARQKSRGAAGAQGALDGCGGTARAIAAGDSTSGHCVHRPGACVEDPRRDAMVQRRPARGLRDRGGEAGAQGRCRRMGRIYSASITTAAIALNRGVRAHRCGRRSAGLPVHQRTSIAAGQPGKPDWRLSSRGHSC
jgi:hypothetical protein